MCYGEVGGESHQREVDVQPYIICQGDYLLKLAYKFDFDPDGVWNDPSNADLRQLRPDPNMLLATDQLNIPDQVDKVPVTYELSTGQTNSFVAQSQLVTVSVRFTSCLCFTCDGQPLQGEAYEVEGADIDPGTLDGDGNFVATIPTTVQQFVVKLTGRKENYVVKVGHLDPPVKGVHDPYYVGSTDGQDPVLSPLYADLHGMPPTLFVTSGRDLLLSGTANLHRAFLNAGADARLVVFDALPHAFWYNPSLPEAIEANHIMADFIVKTLTRTPPARAEKPGK